MNKESLIEAKELLISVLSNSEINDIDKVELMININKFLDEKEYEDNIKVLVKKNK